MFKSVKVKRVLAYFIDIMIVTLISSMFASIDLLNPYLEKQNEITKQYNQMVEEYSKNTDDITKLNNDEMLIEYNYNLSKYGVYTTTITLVVTFLYFVIFQYYNKGRTVGKALFDIMIVDNDMKKASLLKILLRSLIINSILTNGILIFSIIFLSKQNFILASNIVSVFEMGIIFACIILLLFRNDGKLVHDYIVGTKVITTEELDISNDNKMVKSKKVKVRKSDN